MLVNFEEPFHLRSGMTSPLYLDCRRLPSLPTAFKQVCAMLHELIERNTPAIMSPLCIMGVESSGIPFATAVAMSNHWPLCYVRKQAKDHGTRRLVEGIPTNQCALVDDVLTTGFTVAPALAMLKDVGINVFAVAVVVDRRIRPTNEWQLKSLTTLAAIIEHAPSHQAELWKWVEQEQKAPQPCRK